ncbi:MAG TPA: MFS transporter [Candidatus Paenibacillus intestinavium]|nr:MFS transporter [Candidatus Paenibacillus intestinavium]
MNHLQSRKIQSVIFLFVTLFFWISMYIYVPILTPHLSNLNYSLQFIGVVLATYGLIQLLFRFPLGILSDHLQRRKPFIIVGMLCSVCSCLLFLAPDIWIYPVLGRAVAGICASTWVAFTIMYANNFKQEEMPKAMGQISLYTVIGQFIGMIASGWLSDLYQYRTTFIVGAVIATIGLLLSFLLYEQPPASEQKGMSFKLVGSVLRSQRVLFASLLSILAHGVLFITMFGFTPLKAVDLGATGTQLTILIACFMIPHAIAATVAYPIMLKLHHRGTFAISFFISGLCTLALIFVDSLPLMYLTQILNGFAQGLHLPLLLSFAISRVESNVRATAMGLYQALYSVGMFSGPLIAGMLNENFGINSGFLFGSILAFIALLVIPWSLYVDFKKTKFN